MSVSTVRSWRARFVSDGVTKLGKVADGRDRKPVLSQVKIDEIVESTRNCKPEGETQLVGADDGEEGRGVTGDGAADLGGTWFETASGRHVQAVKRSPVRGKLIDVVGFVPRSAGEVYRVIMDEKSTAAALDRTQTSLPMVKGRAATMPHDYKRHGTTTLFAALDVLTGNVIGSSLPRHRHEEFVKSLNTVDRQTPKAFADPHDLGQLRHP